MAHGKKKLVSIVEPRYKGSAYKSKPEIKVNIILYSDFYIKVNLIETSKLKGRNGTNMTRSYFNYLSRMFISRPHIQSSLGLTYIPLDFFARNVVPTDICFNTLD